MLNEVTISTVIDHLSEGEIDRFNQEEIKTNASDDLENSEVIDKPLDGAVASEVNE